MRIIEHNNVNNVFLTGLDLFRVYGVEQESRNGPVLVIPEPVSVRYRSPAERVLFNPIRDCNPFLGFFEALWILEGRDDVKFLSDIVSSMSNYSDDGFGFHGSYGSRLRYSHPREQDGLPKIDKLDQIGKAIERLKNDPNDRRVTMMIRQPRDMWYDGRDSPCNILVDCKIYQEALDITVFNRSNDFIWGMTGTNVVQFSTVQEYMAGMIGCKVGKYHQVTTNMHVYLNDQYKRIATYGDESCDYYSQGKVAPYDMMQGDPNDWHHDLHAFFEMYDSDCPVALYPEFKSPYFKEVVWPMWKTFQRWKIYRSNKNITTFCNAANAKNEIKASDWRLAVEQWMNRREHTA